MHVNEKKHRDGPEVGLAMEEALHAYAVARTLTRSSRFVPVSFADMDIEQGTWPPGPFAAIVASPKAHARRLRERLAGPITSPVILALDRASYGSNRAQLLRADSFVLVDSMLPAYGATLEPANHDRLNQFLEKVKLFFERKGTMN